MQTFQKINPKSSLIKGAAWHVGGRWISKALGFLNTVVLARILMPEDYGIVAMAFLVLGLIQALLDFGAVTALLRKDKVTEEEINSAWTLRLIQCCVVGAIAIVAAPLAVMYFKEPRLEWIVWVLAFGFIISGTGNIGLVLAQKQFNFALEFRLNLIQRVTSVAVMIIAAMILGDYRSLIIGAIVNYVLSAVLSYTMHPYRPRWDVSRIPEIWAVTKWLMFAGVGGFILRKGDELAAGRIGEPTEYGEYNVGADLGAMPVGEIGPAMLRALLPILATLNSDIKRTQAAVVKTMAALHTIIWPIGIGFFALATQATEFILGERWIGAAPLVGIFALVSILHAAPIPLQTYLVLQGQTKVQMQIAWIEFGAFLIASVLLIPHCHLLGLAYARAIGSAINGVSTVIFLKMRTAFDLKSLVIATFRPLIGAFLMYLIVDLVIKHCVSTLSQIACSVLAGGFFYILWSIASWYAVGCPEGLESTVFDKLKR